MSQRFCLFYAGYAASAPSVYFYKAALVDQFLPPDGHNARTEKLSDELEYLGYENVTSIRTAISIAGYFKLELLPEPSVAEEYFKWLKHYIHVFEEQFPLTRIDHYYFFYAQKIAELLVHAGLILALTDIAAIVAADHLNIQYEIDKHLSELEAAIFKTMAAAALLSSEPRHGYFRAFYNEITGGFAQFKSINASELDAGKLRVLNKDIEAFGYLIRNGFKKCILLLKELGV